MSRKTAADRATPPPVTLVFDPETVADAELEIAIATLREKIVSTARALIPIPYFYGADDITGTDCNGVIFQAGCAAGVYPGARMTAGDLFRKLPTVNWNRRKPGDVVCFGTAEGCSHVMLVASEDVLVGTVHGKPPFDGETPDAYRARMASIGARVTEVGSGYWNGSRLGVVRFPALTALENRVEAIAQRAAELEAAKPKSGA